MSRYTSNAHRELDILQRELETIANLTQGSEETVVYMKDSVTSAQRSTTPGNTASLVPLNLVLRPILIQLPLQPLLIGLDISVSCGYLPTFNSSVKQICSLTKLI